MRFNNYKTSKGKKISFEFNDLLNNYNINIIENLQNNGLIKIIALSICVIRILQEEIKHNQNINNDSLENNNNNNYCEFKQYFEIF